MYLDRIKSLQARIHAYQDHTRNLGIVWHEPMPVPTVRRSEQFDYYFSWGRFDFEDKGVSPASLAVFSKNARTTIDLRDPRAFMLVLSPHQVIEDMVTVFKTSIDAVDGGMVAEEIRLIKGIVPEYEWQRRDAERFNFMLNREIATLFILAARDYQLRQVALMESELARIECATVNNYHIY